MNLTLSRNGVSKFRKGGLLRRLSERAFIGSLFPAVPQISDELFEKSAEEIDHHFKLNPCRLNWTLVELSKAFTDHHLILLRWLPEIEILKIYSDRVTDRGVRHLLFLKNLKELLIYSRAVTDHSLELLRRHQKLEVLDMQGCPKVTSRAFNQLVSGMNLRGCWPPHGPRCVGRVDGVR
jgi:hypothetical protein